MKLTVSQAAKLTGVSPKTLRYYDKIGLLRPAEVSSGGYRLYGQAELAKLREILLLRELGFPLKEIAALTTVPGRDKTRALRRQKELLRQKRRHIDGVIALVDKLLKGEEVMNFQAFHTEELDRAKALYAQEAKERWGNTEAYRESQNRERARTKEEEEAMLREMDSLLDRFAALADQEPESPQVQSLVEEWRAHITRWHYDCTKAILSGLGQAYAADNRFAANLDAHGPGTAQIMSRGIQVYCQED